jgi:Flp pilus assembly protein TadD
MMGRINLKLRAVSLAVVFSCCSSIGLAQSLPPTTIQVFMPGGATPPAPVRIRMVRDDGATDTVFTDQRGRYDMPTPSREILNYTVTVDGDKQNYETTTATLSLRPREPGYLSIFLRPLAAAKKPVNEVLDVTSFEKNLPKKAAAAYSKAMESLTAGKVESAISGLQEAISIYPEYVKAYSDLGVIYMKLDRLDEAAAAFRKATEISKRFLYPRMNLGLVLTRQEKFKDAIEVLAPLYQENPGMLEVRLAYANALSGAGEVVEAEKIYRSILELKEVPPATQATVHFKVGFGLNRQRKFAEAVTELDRAIALNPDMPNAHMYLGGALMQVQQNERAERALLKAYELGGASNAGAQFLLGHLYYSQKKIPEATKAFEQYLKDLPQAPNAKQVSEIIASLKAAPKN